MYRTDFFFTHSKCTFPSDFLSLCYNKIELNTRRRQIFICRLPASFSNLCLTSAAAANLGKIKRRHDLTDEIPLIVPTDWADLRSFLTVGNMTAV